MKRAAIVAAAVPLALYAWVVASSAIYCGMASVRNPFIWDLFVFPYTQIIDVWPKRNGNWLLMLIVWSSAALPGALAAIVAVLWWRYRWPNRPLYGNAQFADQRAMRKGGMRLDKSPFSR
jgi:hypothetical protein